MKLTAETKRRLLRAGKAIWQVLLQDAREQEINTGELFPSLYSLYSHLWLKGKNELFKK